MEPTPPSSILLLPPPPFSSSSSSSSSLLPSCKGDYGWTQRLQPVTGSCKRHRQQRSVRYLGVRCRGVGHDGKLTPYRGTVVGGRWTHFSPRAKRRKRGRIADITPLYRLAAHTHTHKPRTPVPYWCNREQQRVCVFVDLGWIVNASWHVRVSEI